MSPIQPTQSVRVDGEPHDPDSRNHRQHVLVELASIDVQRQEILPVESEQDVLHVDSVIFERLLRLLDATENGPAHRHGEGRNEVQGYERWESRQLARLRWRNLQAVEKIGQRGRRKALDEELPQWLAIAL
jgi:hypothetical protein